MIILIAEDDIVSRRILQTVLQRRQHTVHAAPDGEAAWELYQRHGADVVLSDWMMPGIDGLELCRRVRAASGRRGSPYTYFVLLTSLGDRPHFLEGMQAGADDYLVKPFDPAHLEARLVVAERVTRLHQDLQELNRKLWDLARRDALTNLFNRLQLREDLDVLQEHVTRQGTPWSVALCDVDHFKRYNDRYGHLAGDEALRQIAAVLRETRLGNAEGGDERGAAMAYRFGGEEFCLLLDAPPEIAVTALEAARRRIRGCAIPHADNSPSHVVTISVGVAAIRPGDVQGTDGALRAADQALYLAKECGRDRVVIDSAAVATNSK